MADHGQNRETTQQQAGTTETHIAQRLPPLRRITAADVRHVEALARASRKR